MFQRSKCRRDARNVRLGRLSRSLSDRIFMCYKNLIITNKHREITVQEGPESRNRSEGSC